MGQIHEQKKRPKTSVGTMMTSDHSSARCSECEASAVVTATKGSNSSSHCTL